MFVFTPKCDSRPQSGRFVILNVRTRPSSSHPWLSFYDISCSIFGLCGSLFGFSILFCCWLLHDKLIHDQTRMNYPNESREEKKNVFSADYTSLSIIDI